MSSIGKPASDSFLLKQSIGYQDEGKSRKTHSSSSIINRGLTGGWSRPTVTHVDIDVPSSTASTTPPVSLGSTYSVCTRGVILLFTGLVSAVASMEDDGCYSSQRVVGKEFDVGEELVDLSISSFLIACAVGQLMWGSLSDHYGRLKIMIGCLALYVLACVACFFAPDIYTFIVFRGVLGFASAGSYTISLFLVKDISTQANVGIHFGIQMVVSSSIGVFTDMIVSLFTADHVFGWRGVYVLIGSLGVLLLLVFIFVIPETQPYFALMRRRNEEKKGSSDSHPVAIEGEDAIVNVPLVSPLYLFKYLFDKDLIVHYLLITLLYGSLSVTSLGMATMIPELYGVYSAPGPSFTAVVPLIGTFIGGWLSDKSFAAFPSSPSGRLVYLIPFIFSGFISSAIFGFSFGWTWDLPYGMYSATVMILCFCLCITAVVAYISEVHPDGYGPIALLNFNRFLASAILTSIVDLLVGDLGVAGIFGAIALMGFLLSCISTYQILNRACKKASLVEHQDEQ